MGLKNKDEKDNKSLIHKRLEGVFRPAASLSRGKG